MKKVLLIFAFTLFYMSNSSSQECQFVSSPNCSNIECNSAVNYGYDDNNDGYIHKGRITLYRVGSGQGDTFELYVKSATRYVKYNGRYYKIDGVQYVTINNIKYKVRK